VASLRSRCSVEELLEAVEGSAVACYFELGADEDADHVAHEGVGGDVERGEVVGEGPGGGEDVAVEADVVGLGGGEGREVVRADQSCGTCVEGRAVELVWPEEGSVLLEGAGGVAGEHPVAVSAGLGVTPRVEAVGDDRG